MMSTATVQVLVLSLLVLAGPLIHSSTCAAAIKWTRTEQGTETEREADSIIKRSTGVGGYNIPCCEDPGIPDNGARFGNAFQVGAEVVFACNSGYLLRGSEVLVCRWGELNEPLWDGDTPQCKAQVPIQSDGPPDPCGPPPEPSTFAYRHSYTVGEKAEYRCIDDYLIISGDEVLTCTNGSSEWSGDLLQCRRRGQCRDYGDIENGVRLLDGTREGDVVTFQCNERFELLGNRQLTCAGDNYWTGAWPICTKAPANCGDPGQIENGHRTVQGTTEGSRAIYSCMKGYVRQGAEIRYCRANGEWAGTLATCQRVICKHPDVPANGLVEFSSTEFGSVATYECNKGYVLSGSTTTVCNERGKWTNQPPTCSAVLCSALRSPVYGTVRARELTYGSMANYTCFTGFGLVGDSTRMCQSDGVWSGSVPACQSGTCGTLTDPPNGHVTINRMSSGGVALYSCEVGYQLSGSFQRICDIFGVWSDEPPTCQPVRCPMLRAPYNGSLVLSDENKLNSVANYSCNFGFEMIGNMLRVCQSSGIWTGRPPGCYEINCGGLDGPHNGGVTYTDTKYGSEAVYFCNPGYSLRFGDEIRTCINGGRWSGTEPCCIREEVMCANLTAPSNGMVEFDTRVGGVATYTCADDRFVLVGNGTRTCQASGEWSGEQPTCSITCPNLDPPVNGDVFQTGNLPGDTAMYMCLTGYRIAGGVDANRTCQENGEWSGVEPMCVLIPSETPDCGGLTDPENGNVNISTGTTVGSEAVYSCNEGYDLDGPEVRMCTSNGTWTDMEPTCVLRDCGDLTDPENGEVDLTQGTTFGSNASYSCDVGYDLIGPETRTCQSNGEWSDTEPTCMLVECGDLQPPTNGQIDLSNGTTFGSTAVYSCNEFFRLNDSDDTRVCQENGEWSGSAPECNLIECEELVPPPSATLTLSNSNFINSLAVYDCVSNNFKLVGESIRTCTADGWSGQAPSCELIDCGLLNNPDNGSVALSGTTLGSQATYSCDDNFRLIGDDTRECLRSCEWSGSAPVCEPIQCPVLLPPFNGMVDVPNRIIGSIATYSCNDRLTLLGDAQRECLSDETWSGESPLCLLVTCPTLSDPENGNVTIVDNIPGAMAIYRCNPGLALTGDSTRTCGTDGLWSGEPPTCEEILCPVLAPPENGRVFFNERTPGSTASYFCDDGFILVGLLSRICGDDGQWGGENDPICIMMECEEDELGPIENGMVTFDGLSLGALATYTCNFAYTLEGDATRMCIQDGDSVLWSGEIPTCRLITCPLLDDPVNGNVNIDTPTLGGNALYTCNSGFMVQGLPFRRCGMDEQWSGVAPTCVPSGSTVACPDLTAPANGMITISSTTVGSTVTYTCNSGYLLQGPSERTCQGDGTWTGTDPTCNSIDCGPLEVMNGFVNTMGGTTLNSVAIYICNPGFRILIGADPIRICQENGQWSGSPAPTCEVVDCGPLPDPLNGMVDTSAGTTFTSEANYTCMVNYILVGFPTRVCTADGIWSGEAPTCELIAGNSDCGDPGVPVNGGRTLVSTTANSTVEYNCDIGFTISGEAERTCLESGEWTGSVPTCTPVRCPVLPDPADGIVVESGRTVGSQANYFCNIGFFSRPGDDLFRTCLPSGEWSGTEPLCIPNDSFMCPNLTDPANGAVSVDSLEVESIATYTCDFGYTLVGASSLVCESRGRWSELEPVCERVMCDNPGVPENGRRVLDDFTAGSRVYFNCDDGFVSQNQMVLLCLDNGQWDAPTPQCTAANTSTCTGSDDVVDEFGRICSCVNGQLESCCRYRQDWTMLSEPDKQRYINAVLTVASDPTYKPLYTALVLMYEESFNTLAQFTVSEMSHFLPWHRYFLLEYENMLRLVDSSITIPIWDWSLFPLMPYESPVFDQQTGFGNSSSDSQPMCVDSGPFREGEYEVVGGGCLTRQYGDFQFPNRGLVDQFLALNASKFDEFHNSIQLFINLFVRCFVGGDICTQRAVNDPLHPLHLARIDQIFDQWQNLSEDNKNVRFTDEDDPLVLTLDSSLLVSDFACNDNLLYDVCVRYGPLQDIPETTQDPPPSSGPDLPTISGSLVVNQQQKRLNSATQLKNRGVHMDCLPKEEIENLSLSEEDKEMLYEMCGYISEE